MSCNYEDLCDPADPTIKVRVVNPGATDGTAAGFILPALTPYPGDINLLKKCDPESADLLGCDGTALDPDDKFLTQGQGHAPAIEGDKVANSANVSEDCAPELPDCPIDGTITFGNNGITWQIINGAWEVVAVSPCDQIFREAIDPPDFTDADLAAAAAAGGWVTIETRTVCVENDDCVRWRVHWEYRNVYNATLEAGTQIQLRTIPTNANGGQLATSHFDGTFIETLDETCRDDACRIEVSNLVTASGASLIAVDPGETYCGTVEFQVRVNDYVSHPNQEVTGGVFALKAVARRSLC